MTVSVEVIQQPINVTVEQSGNVLLMFATEQGPPGGKGDQGDRGQKGDPGVFDGQVAPADPDPVLLFENGLV